jgi:hypothetical protein
MAKDRRRMNLVVRGDAFVWTAKDGQTRSAGSLHAPAICVFEPVEIWRDGASYDSAAVLFIPAEGYDGFEGFEVLLGEHKAVRTLEPSMFQEGDEIRINLLRGNLPELDYWAGMIE